MLGTTELFIILAIAALLFGGQKLPELARALGSSLGEFRKAQENAAKEDKKE